MFITLAVAVLSAAQQPRVLRFQSLTIPLTGQNGYEEYVEAAVILNQPQNKVLESYIRSKSGSSQTEAVPVASGVSPNASTLDLYRVQARQLEKVFELVEVGNSKPCRYPVTNYSALTLEPELVFFKTAERAIQRAAHVCFAAGDSNKGTRLLIDGLVFARRIAVGGSINALVSRSCEAMAFSGLQRNFFHLGEADLAKLIDWTKSSMAEPTPMLSALKLERVGVRNLYDSSFMLSKSDFGPEVEDADQIVETLKRMPKAQREAIYLSLFKRLEAPWTAEAVHLSEPESQWLAPVDVEDSVAGDDAPLMPHDPPTMMAVGALLRIAFSLGNGDLDVNSFSKIALSERIQTRILGIECAVQDFRWKHDRLPSSLAEVLGSEPTDVATQRPYGFEARADQTFRVFCAVDGIGEVDLLKAGSGQVLDGPP